MLIQFDYVLTISQINDSIVCMKFRIVNKLVDKSPNLNRARNVDRQHS